MTDFVAKGIDAMVATILKMIRFDIEDEASVLSARDEFKGKPAFRFRDETDLAQVLQDFYVWSGVPYVFVIDEWDCLMRETAALVERCHQENAPVIKYNDENSLACVVSLALYAARRQYVAFRELPSGKGYADVAFLPRPGQNVPTIVVELKAGESASIALEQIRRREYPDALKDFSGEMILVGINYAADPQDPAYKRHACLIEKWKK